MIYIIPLIERFTQITQVYRKEKLIEVDGIGIYVKYNDDSDDLSESNIRRHLIGIRNTECILEADSPLEALKKFNEEWDGAKFGTLKKALTINTNSFYLIKEYPSCKLYHNVNGRSVCYNPDYEDDDDVTPETCRLGCILQRSEPPFNCPIKQYKDISKYSSYIEEIEGFKFERISMDKLKFGDISKNMFDSSLNEIGEAFYRARKLQEDIKENYYIKK